MNIRWRIKLLFKIGLVLCCPTEEKGCCIPILQIAKMSLLHSKRAQLDDKLWRLMFHKSKPVSRKQQFKNGCCAAIAITAGEGKGLSGHERWMISQRNRLATYDDLTVGSLWIRIYGPPRSSGLICERGSARASFTSRADLQISKRLTRFLRQSERGTRRLLRSSKSRAPTEYTRYQEFTVRTTPTLPILEAITTICMVRMPFYQACRFGSPRPGVGRQVSKVCIFLPVPVCGQSTSETE